MFRDTTARSGFVTMLPENSAARESAASDRRVIRIGLTAKGREVVLARHHEFQD
jgi:hypothetical protein